MIYALGVGSAEDCEEQITTLESILDSLVIICRFRSLKSLFESIFGIRNLKPVQVYTLRNRTELENVISSAVYKYCFYEPSNLSRVELKVKLESLRLKVNITFIKVEFG